MNLEHIATNMENPGTWAVASWMVNILFLRHFANGVLHKIPNLQGVARLCPHFLPEITNQLAEHRTSVLLSKPVMDALCGLPKVYRYTGQHKFPTTF